MLHLLGRGILYVGALLLVHQQGGIHGNGVLLMGMHGVVDQGHEEQDHAAHDEIHGVEHGGGDGRLIGHLAKGFAGHQVQRNGTGQARMPNDKAGVGGGDEQRIIHCGNAAHHFLGKQGADDQTEAPVQPAADGGHEGGDQDGLLIVVAQTGHSAQRLLAGAGGCHGRTENQHQGHLHGKAQQAPKAALLVAPGGQNLDDTHLGGQQRTDKGNDGQDDGEQECVGQPAVNNAHAAIGESLKHSVTLLFLHNKHVISADPSGGLTTF